MVEYGVAEWEMIPGASLYMATGALVIFYVDKI